MSPGTQQTRLTAPPRRRLHQSGGNTLMEVALTMVPLFAIILGFVNFGLVMFRWATIQNAVREGCRYAITFQTSGTNGQDASIEAVVQQYAMGLVTSTDTPQHIFVNYYAPSNLTTPITTGGNVPGNLVEVSVQNVSWPWLAPLSGVNGGFFSSNPVTFSVYSSDILGAYPVGVNSVTR